MAKKDYDKLASDIVRLVGGKENIGSVSHCMTRLRFILKDEGKSDTKALKQLQGVSGVVQQGGQYQVIIGTAVPKVHEAVVKQTGISASGSDTKKEEGKKEGWVAEFFKMLTKIFIPLLPALAGIGLIRGVLAILTTAGVLTVEDGTYIVLYSVAQCLFYFMPVFLGSTAGKAFGLNPVIGMMIGASMVYPDIINAVGVEGFTFIGLPMEIQNYTSTVLPIIVAVWFASKLDKLCRKIIPEVAQLVMVAPIVLAITVPLTFFIIGPVMNAVSGALSGASLWLYNVSPILCGTVLGGLWPVIVMLGLHHGFTAIFINNLTTLGYEPLLGPLAANNWALTGTLLGFGMRTKQKDLKTTAFSTALTCFLGIGEPGKFAIVVPRKKVWIGYIIASAGGAALGSAMGACVYTVGGSGIFQIPCALNPSGVDLGFIGYILCCVVSLIAGFVLTYLFGLTKEDIEGAE